jgi:hypothetical protein
MSTELIFKLAIAALIVVGYGVVLIVYIIWGPELPNRALDALLGGLSSGYLLVLNGLFNTKA